MATRKKGGLGKGIDALISPSVKKEIEKEKVIEKPVEKIVEKIVEVEKVVEKPVEQLMRIDEIEPNRLQQRILMKMHCRNYLNQLSSLD